MNNDRRIELALGMIEEMLTLAQAQDERHKALALAKGKGEETLGESWEIYHLKSLKNLLKDGE